MLPGPGPARADVSSLPGPAERRQDVLLALILGGQIVDASIISTQRQRLTDTGAPLSGMAVFPGPKQQNRKRSHRLTVAHVGRSSVGDARGARMGISWNRVDETGRPTVAPTRIQATDFDQKPEFGPEFVRSHSVTMYNSRILHVTLWYRQHPCDQACNRSPGACTPCAGNA